MLLHSDRHRSILSSFGETFVRSAVIFLVLLLWPLSLPSTASAGQLSLYGAFDQTHNGQRGGAVSLSTSTPSIASGEVLAGCGRGRTRDQVTHQCKGPADLR
jgi:hypothetical protein